MAARRPDGIDDQELTLLARRILLDAIEALQGQRDAVVLVGAQAVYLHIGTAQLGVAAYTSDGDLGLDPDVVVASPLLQEAMTAAGFTRTPPDAKRANTQPGMWWKAVNTSGAPHYIEVDLMVPAELVEGNPDRRSVSIPPHDKKTLRRVRGLALAVVDNAEHSIASLEPDVDGRAFDVKVAGIPALLIAKAYKLGERLAESPDRLVAKDASDVVGLMLASDADDVAETLESLRHHKRVGASVTDGLAYLHQLFGRPDAAGVDLAVTALAGVRDGGSVRQLAPAYMALLPGR